MNDHPATPASSTDLPAAPDARWILVVDDDKLMLGLMELVLKSRGWNVQVAASADAAKAVVEASPTPPSLMICDVIMAGMDGLQLTRHLLRRIPNLKAIVVSAHLKEESWWPEDLQDCPFLTKPFKNEQLLGAVEDALAG